MNRTARTLLIVDDSATDRELYRRYLLNDQEYTYTLLEADLGQQGLELWQQHRPDVVLLDYRLPDLDGIEFLEQLPSSLEQPCLPVILVTGGGSEAIAVQAMKAGAQDYLIKEQITPKSLQLAVNSVIANVQLRTELQQRMAKERLIAQITQQIHRSLDLEEILQTTVDAVRQFLQADRVFMYRFQPDFMGVIAVESVGEAWLSILHAQVEDSYFMTTRGEDYHQGRIQAVSDIDKAELSPCHRALLARFQIRANLVIPILSDHRLWGLLVTNQCDASRQWQTFEIELLQELTTQIGIALQQAELYQQLQNELAERRRVEAELRASETWLRLALTAAQMGTWNWNIQTGKIVWSDDLEVFFGLQPGEFDGSFEMFVAQLHPDDRDRVLVTIDHTVTTGADYEIEFRVLDTNGKIRWALSRGHVFYDEHGQPTCMAGVHVDITAHKQAEAEKEQLLQTLLAEHAQFEAVLRQMPAGVMIADAATGNLVLSNQQAHQILQYEYELYLELEQYTSEVPFRIYRGDGHLYAPHEYPLVRSLQHGEVITHEEVIVDHHNGSRIFLDARSSPVFDRQGKIISAVTVFQDITHKKQTETALRDSEERFRQLAENINLVFWINEFPQRQLSYISNAYERLWGLNPQDIYQDYRFWLNLVHPEDREMTDKAFAEKAFVGKFDQEYRIILPDGTVRWVRDRCFPLFDQSGKVYRLTGITEDITERKHRELNDQFLNQLDLRLRQLLEPSAMVWETVSSLGQYLAANCCSLGEIDWQQGLITIEQDWCCDVPSLAGTYFLSDFIMPELQATLASGQAVMIHDVTTDARTATLASNHQSHQIRAFVSVPCIYHGSWVASLTVYSTTPRLWREDELALLQETVAHLWPVIEQTRALQALCASEERLQMALEGSGGGLWDWNVVTNEDYLSPQWLAMLGYEPGDLPSHYNTWEQLIHPDDRPWVLAKLQAHLQDDTVPYRFEFRMLTKSGDWKWIANYGKVVMRDEQGHPLRMAGIHHDVSDTYQQARQRQEAELALKASQLQLQAQLAQIEAIYQSAPIGLGVLDSELRFVRINERLAAINGFSVEAHIGHTVQELLPGLVESAEKPLRLILETGQPLLNVEIKGETPAQPGVERTWLEHFLPLKNGEQVIGISIVCEEITERLQSEIALRDSEARFRNMADHAPVMVWVKDTTGYCNYLSQSWYELTGQTEATALGFGWVEAVHPEDQESAKKLFLQAHDRQETLSIEYRLRRKDGEYCYCIEAATPWLGVNGQFQGYIGSIIDISDRKQTELERDRLLALEQEARTAAERANRVKDEFLAILSHELRSPLNPILGWVTLLQKREFDAPKRAEALATIERNAKLLIQLIDDLLDIAKILRGKLSMKTEPVNLISVIEDAIETVRTAATAKSITLHPVLPDIGQICGDAARLQQIVWNLLSNAIKFTPEGGEVEIRLERIEPTLSDAQNKIAIPHAQIIVSDTGKGINPDFLPYIFESFRQEDVSITRKYGGLGLGLAIVRHLVEAHGGKIWAESLGEGKGAKFIMSLPIIEIDSQARQTGEFALAEADLTGIRILGVDDELDARQLLTALLKYYGAEVMTVTCAAEVLLVLESYKPDILISDIGMPNVDGYTLIQQIRALPAAKGGKIPAIAMTAYAGEIDHKRALAVGFQRHLTKPIDPNQLAQTVITLVNADTVSRTL